MNSYAWFAWGFLALVWIPILVYWLLHQRRKWKLYQAKGKDLDRLAALYGVRRLTVPGMFGPRKESDQQLRARIREEFYS